MTELKMKFCGGAGTVTGSCTWLEFKGVNVLVDCGMFQGLKSLRVRNRDKFPFDAEQVTDVILTHAHLDHCGRLPLLYKNGFSGRIHCTAATRELAEIILRDSAKIQEEEADRANREGYSKHTPALPLYDAADVENTLPLFHTVDYNSTVILGDQFKFKLHNAGHILGAAFAEISAGEKKIVFSGDLGRSDSKVMYPPARLNNADAVIMESTYGSRNHPEIDPEDELEQIINECCERSGTLIIPSFAVERAQEIIYYITQLKRSGRIPNIPAYLDSPMGVDATEVFFSYPELHQLDRETVYQMRSSVNLIKDYYRSQSVLHDKESKIVLAGSGMLTGGRVLHYLERHISNPDDVVLLAGFQAAGTRGRELAEGAKEIKLFGYKLPVKAQIISLQGLSAHAGRDEMIEWVSRLRNKPEYFFLNHGEPDEIRALQKALGEKLNLSAEPAESDLMYRLFAGIG